MTRAWPDLEPLCSRLSPVELGSTVIILNFQLPPPYVIHARATNFINDDHSERYLDLAVAQSLRVAKEAGVNSIVMHAFGTGVFKFPTEMAVEIILKGLLIRAIEDPDITLLRIQVGDEQIQSVFWTVLDNLKILTILNKNALFVDLVPRLEHSDHLQVIDVEARGKQN